MSSTVRLRGRQLQQRRRVLFARYPFCANPFNKKNHSLIIAEELDHIVPISKGGDDIEDNWQGLCKECHDKKTRNDFGWKEKPIIGKDGWPIDD